jgi:hypothetical protein
MSSVISARASTSNSSLKIVGIVLAIVSGVLIGSSFVFKKKGLLRSQAGGPAGEGVAYLKSVRPPLGNFRASFPLTLFRVRHRQCGGLG